jgi:hypothetical protein
MLVELIYSSTAVRDFSDEELANILQKAAQNNHRCNVTGLLLYSKGTFMQAIEGESDTIDALFEVIKSDSRHRNITEHVRTQIHEREFSQWHMGYRAISKKDALALPNYAPFFEDGFDAGMLAAKPGACLEILQAIAEKLPA